MSALVILPGVEALPPHFEALPMEPQRLGPHTFDLALKITGGDGLTTPGAQVPAAGANPHTDTPLRIDPQHSRPDLRPDLQGDGSLHSLMLYIPDLVRQSSHLPMATESCTYGHGILVQQA
jgi:hypothetical protein